MYCCIRIINFSITFRTLANFVTAAVTEYIIKFVQLLGIHIIYLFNIVFNRRYKGCMYMENSLFFKGFYQKYTFSGESMCKLFDLSA